MSGVQAHEDLRQRKSSRASLFVYPLMSFVISRNIRSYFLAELLFPFSFCQQLPLRAGWAGAEAGLLQMLPLKGW